VAIHFIIKISMIPKRRGSVGSDILNANPGIISESGSERGVKNTTRNRRVSNAKIANMAIIKAKGNALIIIECFLTRKNAFNKINDAEIK
jgi:hypothetical protein